MFYVTRDSHRIRDFSPVSLHSFTLNSQVECTRLMFTLSEDIHSEIMKVYITAVIEVFCTCADVSQKSSTSCQSTGNSDRLKRFQEKADDAGVVIFVLSASFADSRFTREQVLTLQFLSTPLCKLLSSYRENHSAHLDCSGNLRF